MSDTQLFWTELQEDATRPVELLRVGTFTDRHGQQVEIAEADLDAYIANFEAGEAGQEIPIDREHQKGEAHGWIKRLWREGEKLLFQPEWNELGRKLVGDKVYRYISASIDTASKVIRSASLVNFPAIKGLAPVELSEGVYGLEVQAGLLDRVMAAIRGAFSQGPQTINLSAQESAPSAQEGAMVENDKAVLTEDQIREKVRAEERAKVEAEMAEKEAQRVELRAEVRAEVEAEMAEKLERQGRLREFAEEVCNGEHGISAKPEEVVSALEPLTDEQVDPIKALLKAKVVDFSEHGSSREGQAGKKKLPERIVKEFQAGEITMEDLKDPDSRRILGLVDLSEYDLSEIQAQEA